MDSEEEEDDLGRLGDPSGHQDSDYWYENGCGGMAVLFVCLVGFWGSHFHTHGYPPIERF